MRDIRNSNESCVISILYGFLKYICFDESKHRILYKCAFDESHYNVIAYTTEYTSQAITEMKGTSVICKNDRYSYQVCGLVNDKVTNTDVLCGGHFCDQMERNLYPFEECDQQCRERQHSCGELPTTATVSSTSSYTYAPFMRDPQDPDICDFKCDNEFCSDEAVCNGFQYGLPCKRGAHYAGIDFLPPYVVCDGARTDICSDVNGRDEENCTSFSESLKTCVHYIRKMLFNVNVTVPIFNYTRCSALSKLSANVVIRAYPYCLDFSDQTNCTDVERVGGYCLIKGYPSSVSKNLLCDFEFIIQGKNTAAGLCHDNLENQCISPSISSSSCKVHKHKMCNGKYDCIDSSDENDALCFYNVLDFSCERWFFPNKTINFPYKWIKDGIRDCIGGDDENDTNWLVCKFKNISEPSIKKRGGKEGCNNVFKCPSGAEFVEQKELCDGIESCDINMNFENNVCRIARDFPSLITTVSHVDNGFQICVSLTSNVPESCSFQKLKGIWMEKQVFGAEIQKIGMYLPKFKVECSNLFGEYYAYYSCMDLCLEPEAICPLNDKRLLHDSCRGQFQHRLYTVANSSYITFVRQDGRKFFHENFFQCKNGRCVPHKEVCDLVDNCGDLSDEINCTNHIICKNTLESANKHIISKKQKCDGIYDCFDLSDECNDSCGRQLLHSWFLKGACWTMGVLALFLNLFYLPKGIKCIKESHSGQTLLTNTLVSVINTGDLLIGVYLVILAVYDSIIFGRDFCQEQAVWLTGIACSYIGILSTVGSQLSVFTMTVLSANRAWGIIGNKLTLPSEANKKDVVKVILYVVVIVLASVAVAVLPLLQGLEEYFVQGMYYDPKYKVFIGFPNKARHINVLKEYFNNTVDSQSIRVNMTWREIGEKVDKMFTDDYGTMGRMAVHFYGNDGVCLYKYFVLTDDARRSRQSIDGVTDITEHRGDPMVWLMLAINFLCFVCVAICYAMIYFTTKKSSEESNSCQNPAVQEKNRALELKVTILVATDFLCWVPFIIISGLHNMKVIDASSWYIALSTMLLPLNSVINPLIYSNMVDNFMKKLISLIANRDKDANSTQQNPDEQAVGGIPLEEIRNRNL